MKASNSVSTLKNGYMHAFDRARELSEQRQKKAFDGFHHDDRRSSSLKHELQKQALADIRK